MTGRITRFRIRTGAPKGRNVWEANTAARVQAGLFATVAMIVAESDDAEAKLMKAIADAKAGKDAFLAAV